MAIKKKFRNMEILENFGNDDVLVLYNQFDIGDKYKIYTKYGNDYKFYYSCQNITEAVNYGKQIAINRLKGW